VRIPFRRQPAERFEDVLARCLAAVEAGEATVESCLAAHPQHAARLAPLLRAAVGVRRGLNAAPDPAFARRLRARVLSGAATPPAVPRPTPWGHRVRRPAFAAVAVLVLLAVVLAPAAAVTSANALPGDWNYGLKLKTEEALLALGLRDHLDRADERAREIRQLAVIGRYQEIPEVTRAYRAELVEATKPLERPEAAPPQEVRRIEQRVAAQQIVIQQAAAKVEQEAQQAAAAGPPPPVVVEAHQAAQIALSAAAQTRRQMSRAAEAQAQERGTPTPAGTGSPVPSPTPEPSETASPTVTSSPAAPEGTPGVTGTPEATARPGGPPGAVTLPTLPPATSSATVPAPPAPTRTVPPAPTRTVAAPPSAAEATPPASAPAPSTSSPTPTPRPAGTVPAPPAVTPTPSATPAGPSVAVLELRPGMYTFLYTGPAGPIDTVLTALGLDGKYQWVEWRPAGSPLTVRYEPGITGFRPVITTYAVVTVLISSPANVPQGVLVPLLR
jgi:hypothetical protein